MKLTRVGVVEILVEELLGLKISTELGLHYAVYHKFSTKQEDSKHTSLAALAISEKAAGADMVNLERIQGR